ncbi:MAG: hypothetical protein ACI8UP_004275 [Porticoccaceae bacterium]|jgi:hypothetical protein
MINWSPSVTLVFQQSAACVCEVELNSLQICAVVANNRKNDSQSRRFVVIVLALPA